MEQVKFPRIKYVYQYFERSNVKLSREREDINITFAIWDIKVGDTSWAELQIKPSSLDDDTSIFFYHPNKSQCKMCSWEFQFLINWYLLVSSPSLTSLTVHQYNTEESVLYYIRKYHIYSSPSAQDIINYGLKIFLKI